MKWGIYRFVKRFSRSVTLLTITFVLFIFSCDVKDSAPSKHVAAGKKKMPLLVRTAKAVRGKIEITLELPGTVRPITVANVLAPTEGKITSMRVREGDHVLKNGMIATISPFAREEIVNSARLALDKKKRELINNPGSADAAEQTNIAENDLQFALQQYRQTPVVSPISGVVTVRLVDIGDMVGHRQKLFEIHSTGKFLVEIPVSELDITKIHRETKVFLRADALPDKPFNGKVRRIYPTIEERTRTGTVEIALEKFPAELRSGMFVRASIPIATVKDAVIVPEKSVIVTSEGSTIVFVFAEGRVSMRKVKTGLEQGNKVQIKTGVQEGEIVVTEGNEKLKDGQMVRLPKKGDMTKDLKAGKMQGGR